MTQLVLFTFLGGLLLCAVFYDIYATILRATERPGPLSKWINRGLWMAATRATGGLSRRWRHRVLTGIGPLLMPMLISLMIVMLIGGFALIYLPRMETGFSVNDNARSTPALQAFYFSGITLLTIGYGDIIPFSAMMRAVALIQGATGIAVTSLGIAYLLNVYRALERKRTVALLFYHEAKQGADVAGFLSRHFARGQFHSLAETLRLATQNMHELLESHLEHPIINYFHPLEVYKGMPRAIFVMLETVNLLRSCLDRSEYIEADDHPDVLMAGETAIHVLTELLDSLELQKRATRKFESAAKTELRRRHAFERAWQKLAADKLKMQKDVNAAYANFCMRREQWETKLYWFADFSGYDWYEITGDRDLAETLDGEIEERRDEVNSPS